MESKELFEDYLLEDDSSGLLKEESAEIPTFLYKCSTLFIIDCSLDTTNSLPFSLFVDNRIIKKEDKIRLASSDDKPLSERTTCLWEETIQGILEYAKMTAIRSYFDKIGVILFGVELRDISQASPSKDLIQGSATLIDFDFLTVQVIQRLKAIRKLDLIEFQKKFIYENIKLQLSELLWHVHRLFNSLTNKKTYYNKVVFLTANSNPSLGNKDSLAAIQRVKDFKTDFIEFQLIPLRLNEQIFDYSKFYHQLVPKMVNHPIKISDLSNYIWRKKTVQRQLCQVPFQLFQGITCGVFVYMKYVEQRVPAALPVKLDTYELLRTKTLWVCSNTGSLLDSSQIQKCYNYSGCQVEVKPEAKTGILTLPLEKVPFKVGIELLGFKPISKLKLWHHLKHAYFLYPNETRSPFATTNSASILTALIANLQHKNLFGIVRYSLRFNATPRLGAILPQFEEADEDGEQLVAPGLHLIPLPFAEDIRHLNLSGTRLTEEYKDDTRLMLAKKFVQKIEFSNFDLSIIPNPALENYYSRLESIALNEATTTKITDITNLDSLSENGVIINAARNWDQKCEETVSTFVESKKGSRKETKKRSGSSDDIIEDKVKDYLKNGKLKQLLVVELKEFLKLHGLEVKGVKQELLERVQSYAETQ